MFLSRLTEFLSDDSGAVTADFVPLVAATVGLGLAVTGVVAGGVQDASTDVSATLSTPYRIQTTFPGERMQLLRSNDVVMLVSGKELCATYACDASLMYSELSYSTTDGDRLTRYWASGSDADLWVTEDGTALDYVPERAEGFCSGRCAPPPEVFDVVKAPEVVRISAPVQIK